MIQVCRDTSDAVALYLPQRLYLKSFAKLNISVQLPTHKVHGKAISNWELMEKLRKMIQPEAFSVLKVSKHSSEVIRFDAEIENRNKLDRVISTLEDRVVKLTDYPDELKVRVSEARCDFPSRHAWDSYYRDATDMDEMKPGERPDTVHITNIPIRWFVHERDRDEDAPPSESIFRRVFDKFGEVRQVDIPAADPFRMQMKSSMRGITTSPQDAALYFEGYVQFSEYVGFVRCMDALRGCKLLRKVDDFAEWVSIKVDFDKSKHMTDAAVKRRAIVRERLLARQRAKEDEEKQEKEKQSKREEKERLKHERAELEKLERMRDREEKRKKKQLARLMEKEDVDLNSAVYQEEKKLLKVQKKLQATRLMEELFRRIEIRQSGKNGRSGNGADMSARARLADSSKRELERQLAEQRERFMQALDGRIVIRSALETKKPKPRATSISSISSDERRVLPKRVKTEKLTTPERETEFKKTLGMYGMPAFGYPGFPFAAVAPGYPFPQTSMYYGGPAGPVAGAYYPPPPEYAPRRPYRGGYRGRGRGRARFDKDSYYHNRYRDGSRYEHDDRSRSRSRSRRRSYSRSRSRSRSRARHRTRSRSRRRSYTRSRSHSRGRRERSRSRRSRSRSRKRSRSRSRRRSKSLQRSPPPAAAAPAAAATPAAPCPATTREERASVDSSAFVSPNKMRQRRRSRRSRSRSRKRSRSRSRRRSKSLQRSPPPAAAAPAAAATPAAPCPATTREERASVDSSAFVSPNKMRQRRRSKSWSLPKEGVNGKAWSEKSV